MERIKTILCFQLAFTFILAITSCGGGGGSSSPSVNSNQPQAPILQSINLTLSKTDAFNESDPVYLAVAASYSDGSVADVTQNAAFTLDPPNIGSVSPQAPVQFSSPEIGTFQITASYDGYEHSQALNIRDYVADFLIQPVASLLPIDTSIPILESAWLIMSGNSPNQSVLETATFASLDESIAEFVPKTDSITFNPHRNPAIGHVRTKNTGPTTLTYSHRLTGDIIYHDVEVLPYKLLTTQQDEFFTFNVKDIHIDDNGDTFFLSGSLQLIGNLTISQHSSTNQAWLPDIKIQITPPNTLQSFHGGVVELAVSDNFIVTGWVIDPDGVYIAIYDRTSNATSIEKLDDFVSQERLNVAIDSQERIIACWDARCRVKPLGGIWSPIQNVPGIFPSLDFSDSDDIFLVYRIGSSPGATQLMGQKFTSSDTGLVADTPSNLTPLLDVDPYYGTCQKYSVSKSGHFVCGLYYYKNVNGFDTRLYSVAFHTDSGWRIDRHFNTFNSFPWNAWTGAIADTGDMLFVGGHQQQGTIVDRHYEHGVGWKPENLIADSLLTPSFNDKPHHIGSGWRMYMNYLFSVMTYANGSWTSTPFFKAYRHWGISNSSEIIDFSSDGSYAMAWNEQWAYYNAQGGYTNNSLYFLLPKYWEQ